MTIYVVTEETGEYSQTGWCVKAAFTNREAAERYKENMEGLPGIPGEYAPGREARYEIEELTVWSDAPERVMRWHVYEIAGPGTSPRTRAPYRSEEFYPTGYTGDLISRIDWAEHEPGWRDIYVTAATEAECMAEYARLRALEPA